MSNESKYLIIVQDDDQYIYATGDILHYPSFEIAHKEYLSFIRKGVSVYLCEIKERKVNKK